VATPTPAADGAILISIGESFKADKAGGLAPKSASLRTAMDQFQKIGYADFDWFRVK